VGNEKQNGGTKAERIYEPEKGKNVRLKTI
jgi:hypothetical protein